MTEDLTLELAKTERLALREIERKIASLQAGEDFEDMPQPADRSPLLDRWYGRQRRA